MFRDIIQPTDTLADWQDRRKEIHNRIMATMGTPPSFSDDPHIEYLECIASDGLKYQTIKYSAIPGFETHGTLVLPESAQPTSPAPAVICMHGTDPVSAHKGMMDPEQKPHRAYAVELAQKGFVTLAVDLLGYGEGNNGRTREETVEQFYKAYPEWSMDGAALRIHQSAIDLLCSNDCVKAEAIGCIGNSLGGRSAIYTAALDQRIKAAVPSTGISPNITNIFRNPQGSFSLSPELDRICHATGIPPFEYQEMIAMAAPRALLLLEPWNDTCNPMVEPALECFQKARFVFDVCGVPENLQILCHGDGHDTVPRVRHYAYEWLKDQLQ